ncbi:MAG: hypothetical protein FWC68_01750 [Oscillospiraceae bacterium]|nr:hypothetical protein [Oscillospiraceae bacterium]
MTKNIRLILALVIVLSVILGGAVFATAAPVNEVTPMEGEEIDTGEGYENIIPISETIDIDPISEDYLDYNEEWNHPLVREIESTVEDEEEDETDNTWLYVGIGVGAVVLVAIVVVIVKKK